MMKHAFWLTLASVGALVACGDKDVSADDTGAATTAGETTTEEPPSGDAEVEIANYSGYTLYYVWQCDYSEDTCYDALGSGVLSDGDSLVMALDPGAWYTIIVDEDDYCATSGLYEVESGESYYWKVTESDLYGSWDGYSCY